MSGQFPTRSEMAFFYARDHHHDEETRTPMTPRPHDDMPPGLARAFERGAIHDDLPPADPPPSEVTAWFRKNLTLTNVIGALILLFQLGQTFERRMNSQQDTNDTVARTLSGFEVRLAAAEALQKNDGDVFMRKDVVEERLKAIEVRLANIETFLRERRKERP